MSARLVCAHFSKIVEPRTWRLLITACVFQVVSGRGLGEFGGGSALEVAVQSAGGYDPGFLGGFRGGDGGALGGQPNRGVPNRVTFASR